MPGKEGPEGPPGLKVTPTQFVDIMIFVKKCIFRY